MKNAVALALAAVFVTGQMAIAADPQQQRQESMKNVGQAMGHLGKTMQGQVDFDAEAVQASFQQMNDEAKTFADKFPEGSETGHETEAGPKIWSDRSGFEVAVQQFETDTAEAFAAAPQDMEAFRASFQKVARNCQSCHETYRVKNN